MKKLLVQRIAPVLLSVVLLCPVLVAPAHAEFVLSSATIVGLIETAGTAASFKDFVDALSAFWNDNDPEDFGRWATSTYDVTQLVRDGKCTDYTRQTLDEIARDWNQNYGHGVNGGYGTDGDEGYWHADVGLNDEMQYYYLRLRAFKAAGEPSRMIALTYPDGTVIGGYVDEEDISDIWIKDEGIVSGTPRRLLAYEALNNKAQDYNGVVIRVGEYYMIYNKARDKVLASPSGIPYSAQYESDKWVSGSDRGPDTTVNVDGENVDVIEGNQTNIDLGNMLLYLPDGSINLIDQIIYDESTKSYHIDAHDEYNLTVNNYYTWNYYINYTSITYIGQTEEYNKYYEVYYELPDGRDSADLTKEELEQLNLSIDVIPYGRSADDTSLRSLYHFDGDTRDSSYWNYCTDFTWNKGASLTYMDSGVFDGALYLDEMEHDFTMLLPSGLGGGDFTLQFRYYQSLTEAPVTDSYIQIDGLTLFQFSGGKFKSGAGADLADTPIGTWNEIALIRSSGVLYYYLNGVCIGSMVCNTVLSDDIRFFFGTEQQTFKYFDELRVLNYALQIDGGTYECTSVPHDTNLALVLPTDSIPVADEYWIIENENQTNLLSQYNLDWYDGRDLGTSYLCPETMYTGSSYNSVYNTTFYYPHTYPMTYNKPMFPYVHYLNGLTSIDIDTGGSVISSGKVPAYSMHFGVSSSDGSPRKDISSGIWSFLASDSIGVQQLGTYTLSMVAADGSIGSYTLDISNATYYSGMQFYCTEFNGYRLGFFFNNYNDGSLKYVAWFIQPISEGSGGQFVYLELVKDDHTDITAEFIGSVTAINKDSLNTPTLAVRTDIDITNYQIGGVRPSVPTKGQVWALVENERIVSLQVYNGQAWESVDGRIWTGSRWIPASSYNIVTLQDMYDIVDATPDFEYIYTETGFWSWWQKSWNAFTEKLFSLLGSGGTGGGSGATGGSGSSGLKDVDLDEDAFVWDPEEEDSKTLWQFIVLVIDGGKSVVSGVRHLFSGVVSTVPETMDNITGAFDSGGIAVGALDGTSKDPDAVIETYSVGEGEVLDPWRYR